MNLDKFFKDGRNFLDLMEIFGFDCLIIKVIWKMKILEIFFDLILISNKKKILVFGVVDM